MSAISEAFSVLWSALDSYERTIRLAIKAGELKLARDNLTNLERDITPIISGLGKIDADRFFERLASLRLLVRGEGADGPS